MEWKKWIAGFRRPRIWLGIAQGVVALFLLDLWVYTLFGIWPPALYDAPWRATVLQAGAMLFFFRAADNLLEGQDVAQK